ncbi:DUF637 domain-containing protein, partial [Pseudomonas sp. AL03]|uniref:DUF637 domain-containing protein n=1 Tax=Pseudomonas sp. AL03 TaxID=3042230 RepID=UPI00249C14CB
EGDQRYQVAKLESGKDITLDSGGSITFEAVKDSHQESHDKSSNSWAWTSMENKGQVDETLRQSQLIAKGQTLIKAVDGLHIDIKDINQQSVSQAIDAMVQADPSMAWLKDAEARGDVDWRRVKELHDSWDESHSGLGGPAMIIIIIIVTYFTAGAASTFVASAANAGAGSALAAGAAATAATATTAATQAVAAGWANAALTAMLTSAASTATVSTINNKGNLGAAVKETFSADSMKNYIVAGAVAGLTTGLFNDWTSTSTDSSAALTDSTNGALANTGKVVVSNSGGLSSLEGIAQFTANQALQNSTSALLNKALGRDGSLGDALQSSLVNAFAAYGFNLVGDISVENSLPNGGLAKIGLHAVMGGLASLAAGGDFKTGALAAGVNEALVDGLASVYAGMPKENRDRLLLMNSQLIGVLATAIQDPDAETDKLQTGAWVTQNGTQYNFLNHDQLEEAAKKLRECKDAACRADTVARYKELNFAQDLEAAAACSASQASCADYSREVANTMANLDDIYPLLGDGPTQEWEVLRESNLGFQEMLATFTAGHTGGAIAQAVQQKWGLSDEQTKVIADNLVLVVAGGVAAVAAKKALVAAFGAKATGKVIAEYGPMNQGPLPKGIADTFRSGTYSEVVTQQPTTLYRVYGGTAQELGGYWTERHGQQILFNRLLIVL